MMRLIFILLLSAVVSVLSARSYADSISAVAGSIFGVSTMTTYLESSAGIAAGGRTGLTAFVVGILFLFSVFLSPLFSIIPSAATSCVLIYVGLLMVQNIKKVDFSDVKNAIPSYLTIILIPMSYGITSGIGVGIIAYVMINFIIYLVSLVKTKITNAGEIEKPNFTPTTVIIFILFILLFVLK